MKLEVRNVSVERKKLNIGPFAIPLPSLKKTWHLKMDGWNTIVSFWGPAYFQVQTVSFRECRSLINLSSLEAHLDGQRQ